MRKLLLGFMIGALVTGLGTFVTLRIVDSIRRPKIERFEHPTATPDPAGPAGNFSHEVLPDERFSLRINIADSGADPITNSSAFVRYEAHVAKLEVHLVSANGMYLDRWESLNITQPTIELLSLRGGGAVAEIGGANVAAGQYDTIRLTLGAIRGVRPNGQRVEIPHAGSQALLIGRPFAWQAAGAEHQIVVDLDTLNSVKGDEGSELFTPILRRVLDNDDEL